VEEAIAGAGGTGILTLAWEWMRGNERSGRSRNSTPRSGSLPSSEIFYARGQDDEQAGPRSFAQPKPCRSIDPPAMSTTLALQVRGLPTQATSRSQAAGTVCVCVPIWTISKG
jgi:hypothetical protein